MNGDLNVLHSHSRLEGLLQLPKHTVLIDARFGNIFPKDILIPFTYNGVSYYKVNTYLFSKAGGLFKNFDH